MLGWISSTRRDRQRTIRLMGKGQITFSKVTRMPPAPMPRSFEDDTLEGFAKALEKNIPYGW